MVDPTGRALAGNLEILKKKIGVVGRTKENTRKIRGRAYVRMDEKNRPHNIVQAASGSPQFEYRGHRSPR